MALTRKQIWERVIKLSLTAIGRDDLLRMGLEDRIYKVIHVGDSIWTIKVFVFTSYFNNLLYYYVNVKVSLPGKAGDSFFSANMDNECKIIKNKYSNCSIRKLAKPFFEIIPYEEQQGNWDIGNNLDRIEHEFLI